MITCACQICLLQNSTFLNLGLKDIDTELYLACKPDNNGTQFAVVHSTEDCNVDFRKWVIKDKLMLKKDKARLQ